MIRYYVLCVAGKCVNDWSIIVILYNKMHTGLWSVQGRIMVEITQNAVMS